jgi:hypothetical protein
MKSLWSTFESIPGQSAVTPVWHNLLGSYFEPFSAAFLQRRPFPARFVPCPNNCGCLHQVILHPQGHITASCCCDSTDCQDLTLTPSDVTVWELSWSRLARRLSIILGLNPLSADLGLPNTRQIGSWSSDAVPVILTIQTEPHNLLSVIAQLAARLQQKFILLIPTADLVTANCRQYLKSVGADFFTLDSCIRISSDAIHSPTIAPGELFARFTPQPKEIDQDVAQRAFALIQQLESNPSLPAPSVLTVFRLCCIEALSAAQAARKLHCSRVTVCRRLKLIRAKTGIAPEYLRTLSPHIASIQDQTTDPRARHIHRKNLTDDHPDPDDSES